MATIILGAKTAKSAKRLLFLGLPFHNGWQDGKADGRVDTLDIFSTLRTNWVLWSTNPEV